MKKMFYIFSCKGLPNVAKGTVFQQIRTGVGFKTGGFVEEKLGGGYRRTTVWKKKKVLPDEQSHGLGIVTKFILKKKRNSDDFGLRRPVVQKPFSPKNGIPLS